MLYFFVAKALHNVASSIIMKPHSVVISLYFSCWNYGSKKDIGQAFGKMGGNIPGKHGVTGYTGHYFASDPLWTKCRKEPG